MKKGEKMIIDKIEDFFLKIAERIGLKKLADWYREHREGMRYLVFGVLSTIINIVVFAICERMLHLSTIISNVIAWIIAVLFAYITNKLYVFDSKTTKKQELAKEIISFFSARIFTLVIETIFLKIVIDKLGFNEILMKIISNVIVIVLNYVFSKIFIFKEEKNSFI
ncbi:MAG TPA: hypothetical protein DEP51_01235 [Clostridiales bacterium]|nr:hypothetical protein [Clostridiales bacterium]